MLTLSLHFNFCLLNHMTRSHKPQLSPEQVAAVKATLKHLSALASDAVAKMRLAVGGFASSTTID